MSDRLPPLIQHTVSYYEPRQVGVDATLTVTVFGVWNYTRTASTPDGFLAFTTALDWLPGIGTASLAFGVMSRSVV